MNAFSPPPPMQGGYPQAQIQSPMQQRHFQPQQPQFIQPIQDQMAQPQFVQNPQLLEKPMPLPQQQFQGVPNMPNQQVQQVQQVLQSYPPEKLEMIQQQVQQVMPPQQILGQQQMMSPQPILPSPPIAQQPASRPNFTTTAPSGLFGSKHSSSSSHGGGPQDAQKSDKVKRFFGDTLVGRVARSSVQTATSMAKMPTALSPWGDNNPVTLPNVRYRDAVLFTTFAFVGGPLVDGAADSITSAFGADSFIAEIVNSGAGAIAASTVLKYGVFQIVEQAIDKGIIEHMLPEEEKMLTTTNVKSLQVGIKHKLMGVDADLRFVGIYPSQDPTACAKGWFCPYLFASARTPSIPRANDFAIAQSFGPFLGGDYLLAHKLLSESVHVLPMCEANPEIDIGTNRLLVLFTGIAPYRGVVRPFHIPFLFPLPIFSYPKPLFFFSQTRNQDKILTQHKWSQSRRPGCGTLIFHLLDGCPTLVLPVTKAAPITAWSPWNLSQMRTAASTAPGFNPQAIAGAGGYQPAWQHEQICEWLDTIISVPHVNPALQKNYVEVLGRMVSLVINGALALERCAPILGKLDAERAGICFFRY